MGGFRGRFSDVTIHYDHMKERETVLRDILMKHTGRTLREVNDAIRDGDKHLNPQEALEWGLIDKIVTTRSNKSDE